MHLHTCTKVHIVSSEDAEVHLGDDVEQRVADGEDDPLESGRDVPLRGGAPRRVRRCGGAGRVSATCPRTGRHDALTNL